MLSALKNNQKLQQLSLDLLKLSLTGDDQDYWRTYDSLISLFGYKRIFVNGHPQIIRQHQYQNYIKYQQLMIQKIQQTDELLKSEVKRFWQSQLKDSDQFQCPQNIYYCILTPVNFMLNMEIQKHNDFKFSPYAFVNADKVIYPNSCALKKGIIQGLPVILAQKIDPQTKFIQISKYTNTKWGQLIEILNEKYKGVDLINNEESIHFVLRQDSKVRQNDRMLLKKQLGHMIEDIFSISGVRMLGIVSRSEIVSQIVSKSIPLSLVTNSSFSPIILLSKTETRSYLSSLSIQILPYLSVSHIRLLSSMNIGTIKQVLQHLWILQVVLSKEETMIIMESCLGLDHRDNKWYIEQKQQEFKQVGLNYQNYVRKQETGNNTIEGLNIMKNSLLGQKDKLLKIHEESDMESIKSERVNNIITKQVSKPSKSQSNYKSTPLVSKQQQSLAGFIKKTKK